MHKFSAKFGAPMLLYVTGSPLTQGGNPGSATPTEHRVPPLTTPCDNTEDRVNVIKVLSYESTAYSG
jgi:hypothetical protein